MAAPALIVGVVLVGALVLYSVMSALVPTNPPAVTPIQLDIGTAPPNSTTTTTTTTTVVAPTSTTRPAARPTTVPPTTVPPTTVPPVVPRTTVRQAPRPAPVTVARPRPTVDDDDDDDDDGGGGGDDD